MSEASDPTDLLQALKESLVRHRDVPADFMFRDVPDSYVCGPNGCRTHTTEELSDEQ